MKQLLIYASILFYSMSCTHTTQTSSETNQNVEDTQADEKANQMTDEQAKMLAGDITMMREGIESRIDSCFEITSEDLVLEQEPQWKSMKFCQVNGDLMKITTSPLDASSQTLTNFYLMNGQLMLAVIKDKTEPAESPEIERLYYFNNGEPIEEINSSLETTNLSKVEIEKLQLAVQNYYAIYVKVKKQ